MSYVYLGGVENLYYPGPGLEKFENDPLGRFELVFENPGVKIFRVEYPERVIGG